MRAGGGRVTLARLQRSHPPARTSEVARQSVQCNYSRNNLPHSATWPDQRAATLPDQHLSVRKHSAFSALRVLGTTYSRSEWGGPAGGNVRGPPRRGGGAGGGGRLQSSEGRRGQVDAARGRGVRRGAGGGGEGAATGGGGRPGKLQTEGCGCCGGGRCWMTRGSAFGAGALRGDNWGPLPGGCWRSGQGEGWPPAVACGGGRRADAC